MYILGGEYMLQVPQLQSCVVVYHCTVLITLSFLRLSAGSLQGLHNAQASYNMQTVQNSMSSRNQGMGGSPSSGGHQSTGNLPTGRFSSNNLPVGFTQVFCRLLNCLQHVWVPVCAWDFDGSIRGDRMTLECQVRFWSGHIFCSWISLCIRRGLAESGNVASEELSFF